MEARGGSRRQELRRGGLGNRRRRMPQEAMAGWGGILEARGGHSWPREVKEEEAKGGSRKRRRRRQREATEREKGGVHRMPDEVTGGKWRRRQ